MWLDFEEKRRDLEKVMTEMGCSHNQEEGVSKQIILNL